jgi:hypothetical protein
MAIEAPHRSAPDDGKVSGAAGAATFGATHPQASLRFAAQHVADRFRQARACPVSSPLASRSVAVHVARGVLGLITAILGVALAGVLGPVSLIGLVITLIAWRGCPTCWMVGLAGTRADARTRRQSSPAPGDGDT